MNGSKFIPPSDPSNSLFWCAMLRFFEALTCDLDETRRGVVFMCKADGFSWRNFSYEIEKRGSEFYQQGFPIRVVKMCIVDPPFLIYAVLKLVSMFLNEKMRKRMQVISSDELHTIIHKNETSPILGGTYAAFSSSWEGWFRDCMKRRDLAESKCVRSKYTTKRLECKGGELGLVVNEDGIVTDVKSSIDVRVGMYVVSVDDNNGSVFPFRTRTLFNDHFMRIHKSNGAVFVTFAGVLEE